MGVKGMLGCRVRVFTMDIFYFRVMMGGFPLIIPNDPVMKMKIEEKALSAAKKY